MINYILGEKHPQGDRIVDTQKCFRSQDIEEVGDNRHTTFLKCLVIGALEIILKRSSLAFFI